MRYYMVSGLRTVLTCGEHVQQAIAAVTRPGENTSLSITHQPPGQADCGFPFDADPLSRLGGT